MPVRIAAILEKKHGDPVRCLPKRNRNHAIGEMADTAFRRHLVERGAFIL